MFDEECIWQTYAAKAWKLGDIIGNRKMHNDIDHGHSQSRDALRALRLYSTEIAQYLRRLRNNIDHGHSQSRDALRATEKKIL